MQTQSTAPTHTIPYWKDMMTLTKPRICILALIMAAMGYALGSYTQIDWIELTKSVLAIAMVGASCGALNMYIERNTDALMARTKLRPLPAGRVPAWHALFLGAVTFILGMGLLWIWTNPLTMALGFFTWLLYLFVYTPSKKWSTFSTLIGALPGAMPPLMGYTAATGHFGPEGLLLFGILFIWQIPHFLAIAWMYREDYARASMPILSVVDTEGSTTSRQILGYTLALIPLSLMPSALGETGAWYLVGAFVLGVLFLSYGIVLAVYRTRLHARRLFFVSLLYLPALGALWIWDRLY